MQTVRHLLSSKGYDIFSVTPDLSVYDAIKQMAERGVGALLVTEGETLAGIMSERDYARKIILKGRRSRDTQVGEIMSADLTTVTPSDTVQTCMQLMTDKRIRHLPVLDDGALVGVISIGDVVKSIMSQQADMIEQLESYISGGTY